MKVSSLSRFKGNTLETFLTEQQLKEYLSKEYPFNTNFLGQILKEKLKEDPEYEVWVPLFYCRYSLTRKDLNSPSVVHTPLILISNKGGLLKYRKGDYIPVPTSLSPQGYVLSGVKIGTKKRILIMLHRALASVFIPLPPELKLYHPKDLQVNHIDGVKWNFELSNLEWVTENGKIARAVKNGLIKSGKDSPLTRPVKGRIEFGLYSGHEFILYGRADYKKYGFIQTKVVICCKGRMNSHRKCTWGYATELELSRLPHGLSKKMQDSLAGIRKSIYSKIPLSLTVNKTE